MRKIIYVIAVLFCVLFGCLNQEISTKEISYAKTTSEYIDVTPIGVGIQVNFNSNGGSEIDSFYFVYNQQSAVYLPVPTKRGFEFMGWYVDSDLTEKADSTLSNLRIRYDIYTCQSIGCSSSAGYYATLYAKWDEVYEIPCIPRDGGAGTLKFVTNGGNAIANASLPLSKYMIESELPIPIRNGYNFEGWYVNPDVTEKLIIKDNFAQNLKITSYPIDNCNETFEATLYAKWSKITTSEVQCPIIENEYSTIKFKSNGGNSQNELILCTSCASKSVTLPTPTRSGYRFLGWYSDSNFKNKITITSTKDTNLANLSYQQEYTDSTKKCLTGNKSTTLYAKWEKISDSSTNTCPDIKDQLISINYNTYTDEKMDNTIICTNCDFTPVNLPTPKRDGYVFDGWYTSVNYNRKVSILNNQSKDLDVLETIIIEQNGCQTGEKITTLFAKWKKDSCNTPNQMTLSVSFETLGMSEIADEEICLSCSERKIELQTPYQLGYIFAGWYADQEYTTLVKIDSNTSADLKKLYIDSEKNDEECETGKQSTTLYARWYYYNDLEKITINYKTSDVVVNTTSYNFNDSDFKLPEYEFEGYTLEGWYADKEFTKQILTKEDLSKSYYGSTLADNGKEVLVSLYAKLVPNEKTEETGTKDYKLYIIIGVLTVIIIILLITRKNKKVSENKVTYTINPKNN